MRTLIKRGAAADALVRGGTPGVPVLIGVLESGDRIMRESAAVVLGRIGGGAREAIPALERAWQQDASGFVREAAARALGEMTRSDVPTPPAAGADS